MPDFVPKSRGSCHDPCTKEAAFYTNFLYERLPVTIIWKTKATASISSRAIHAVTLKQTEHRKKSKKAAAAYVVGRTTSSMPVMSASMRWATLSSRIM